MADMKALTVGGITYNIKDAGAVHTPETARVGQTLAVSALDETGKPAAWECADLGSTLKVVIQDGITNYDGSTICAHIQNGGNAVLEYNGEVLGFDHYNATMVSFVGENAEEGITTQVDIYEDGSFDYYQFEYVTRGYLEMVIDTKLGVIENGTY